MASEVPETSGSATEEDRAVAAVLLDALAGRSIAATAADLGMNEQVLGRYLRGERPIRLRFLAEYCRTIDVNIDSVLRLAGLAPPVIDVAAAIESDPSLTPAWKHSLKVSYRGAVDDSLGGR